MAENPMIQRPVGWVWRYAEDNGLKSREIVGEAFDMVDFPGWAWA